MKKLILTCLGVLLCTTLFVYAAENSSPYGKVLGSLDNTFDKKWEEKSSAEDSPSAPWTAVETDDEDAETIQKNAELLQAFFREYGRYANQEPNAYSYNEPDFETMAKQLFHSGIADFAILPKTFFSRDYVKKVKIPGKAEELPLVKTTFTITDKTRGKVKLAIWHGMEWDKEKSEIEKRKNSFTGKDIKYKENQPVKTNSIWYGKLYLYSMSIK